MNGTLFFILAAGILALYPVVMRVLAYVVQGKRLRLIEVGRLLAQEKELSPEWRKLVLWMLEQSFSAKLMPILAFATPLCIVEIFRKKSGLLPPVKDKHVKDLLDEFTGLYIASIAAANPVFAVVVSLELSLLTFILYPLGKAMVGTRVPLAVLMRVEQRALHSGMA